MGPPKISVTTRARMLKLKIQLDIVKYSLWVNNISPLEGVQGAYGQGQGSFRSLKMATFVRSHYDFLFVFDCLM